MNTHCSGVQVGDYLVQHVKDRVSGVLSLNEMSKGQLSACSAQPGKTQLGCIPRKTNACAIKEPQ